MNGRKLLSAAVGCLLTCSIIAAAQEKGSWRAASSTAKATTGDVDFLNEKIAINFSAFPIAQIRTLAPGEASAAFAAEINPGGSGNLYRLSIPAEKRFLHHNTLCGSEETQWMVTYVAGRTLQIAFFSGPKMPVLTPEALANATDLCGTYTYVR